MEYDAMSCSVARLLRWDAVERMYPTLCTYSTGGLHVMHRLSVRPPCVSSVGKCAMHTDTAGANECPHIVVYHCALPLSFWKDMVESVEIAAGSQKPQPPEHVISIPSDT